MPEVAFVQPAYRPHASAFTVLQHVCNNAVSQ